MKKLSISRQLSGRLSKNLIFSVHVSLPIIGATINVKIQIHTMRNDWLLPMSIYKCRSLDSFANAEALVLEGPGGHVPPKFWGIS